MTILIRVIVALVSSVAYKPQSIYMGFYVLGG